MSEKRISPVLKWAGGKTQLLESIEARMPSSYNRYFEPFVGGGSVLLHFIPERAFINDINRQLVNLYEQLKTSAEAIIEKINDLDAMLCDKNLYYVIRSRYNEKIARQEFDADCAALMVWINKHCFNGLYRVNSKGFFNVPYNNKTSGKSIDEENIWAISEYLQNAEVTISCLDFEEACNGVSAGDFV